MKYDKINFLYRQPTSIHSSYMYFQGLENALRRNNLLHYVYRAGDKEPLNIKELLKYPILSVNGSWEPVFSVVKRANKRQFVAEINSEPLFKSGHYRGLKRNVGSKILKFKKYLKIFKASPGLRTKELFEHLKITFNVNFFKDNLYTYKIQKKRAKHFSLYFSPVKKDLGKYFKNCYWFPSWAHTELLDHNTEPISDKILFFGAVHDKRRDFFKEDKKGIIDVKKTILRDNPKENIIELGNLINKYRFGLCFMGVDNQYVPGKIFEYMACKRLCFCYFREGETPEVKELFKDGKEIVYFKDFKELEKKYQYYLKNREEADRIAEAGYEKVKEYHNADVRAKYFAEMILRHVNGKKY